MMVLVWGWGAGTVVAADPNPLRWRSVAVAAAGFSSALAEPAGFSSASAEPAGPSSFAVE